MMLLLPVMLMATLAQPVPSNIARDKINPTDVIVMGDVKSLDYESLDEFGLNVQITARLKIKRVLKGKIAARSVTIRYIAHTDLPERNTIRFRLRRSGDGVYLVCSSGGRGYICD